MGSEITLSAGKLNLDWGKNQFFTNYSSLFKSEDLTDISYDYADEIVEIKPGYKRPLKNVRLRLDLLGYSMKSLESMYKDYLKRCYEPLDIEFSVFCKALSGINLSNHNAQWEHYEFEMAFEGVIHQAPLEELTRNYGKRELLEFIDGIDPLLVLRLFCENPSNENSHVYWQTNDVIEGGWVTTDEVYTTLGVRDKYLIITEGSSDSFILKKSLELLKPDITDFFYFVDMEENYPFTGTGNLYNFCQGLSSIMLLNKVIVVFDNDVEGVINYSRTKALDLPSNISVMTLPNMVDFENFQTVGPSGVSVENINGKGVAIECFLDMPPGIDPVVRWHSFNKNAKKYQGVLEKKDKFVKHFKKSYGSASYQLDKLGYLLDRIIETAIAQTALK